MTLILIGSLAASPGATTTAVGLALHWPRPVVLVDADAHAQQAITAGFRGEPHPGGMMALLHDLRQRSSLRDALLGHTIRLVDDEHVRLLPGFTQPGAHDIFTGWRELAEAFLGLDEDGVDVIVDLGRFDVDHLPMDLLRAAERLLVATRTTLRSLTPLSTHLPALLERVETNAPALQPELLVIAPDRPYSVSDVTMQFGLPAPCVLPWSPDEAAVLSDGAASPRRERRLQRALAAMARRLGARGSTLVDTHQEAMSA